MPLELLRLSLFKKAPPIAFKTHTEPHQAAVTLSLVTFQTATAVFKAPGEPKAVCVALHKHLQLLQAVANPFHGWIGRGNAHLALLIFNSKQLVAPSAAQQPPFQNTCPVFHTVS